MYKRIEDVKAHFLLVKILLDDFVSTFYIKLTTYYMWMLYELRKYCYLAHGKKDNKLNFWKAKR